SIVQGGFPANALDALAELLAVGGDLEAARIEAERALSIQPTGFRRRYYAGLFALRTGDEDAAAEHLQTIVELLIESQNESAWIYRDALQAEILLARGDPEEALPLLQGVVASGELIRDLFVDWSTGGPAIRDALARAHEALGQKEEAVAALRALLSSGFERLGHPVPYVLAMYKLGALEAELGDKAESRRYLEMFLDHWGDADWPLAEVDDARRLLATLQDR
ncbi:MAG: tetratricopeptide repeat protein, partial [Acidobacteria bacterium]|nr:tetratricopeptide repeat protein [Acidobacteriota bacterium]